MSRNEHDYRVRVRTSCFLITLMCAASGWAGTGGEVQDRLDADIAEGRPVVVHTVVALCDNDNQGIVPVPRELGNGQDPGSNLYWGALYGVRTHLSRKTGWVEVEVERPRKPHILDRVAFSLNLQRNGNSATVFLVADAWDGAHIREALEEYFRMAAGSAREVVEATIGSRRLGIPAGGDSHLVAYVGHNGLMDFSMAAPVPSEEKAPTRSAAVLACKSRSYFYDHLQAADAHPLLLTTGLMAPEAYTLESAVRAWVEDRATGAVVEAAAEAYDKYQQCGIRGARRLFWGAP